MVTLKDIETPALIVDEAKMMRNIARMRARLSTSGGCVLRPHLKTVKSIDIAKRLFPEGPGPITVSTLLEAERFAQGGYRDTLYAVGMEPGKLARARRLRQSGVELTLIADSPEAVDAMAASPGGLAGLAFLIEIDVDSHRAGIPHNDPTLLIATARNLTAAGGSLRGVMTHAGGSYNAADTDEIAIAAQNERERAVACARTLRAAGFDAPVVSIGSTPTALAHNDLDGVTEIRAGVYVFFDLVMAGLGVCEIDDIALSVMTSVIGRRPEKGWLITDAGWMALSRDRGTASQRVDQGYGLVCDAGGTPIDDMIVSAANQEHGILSIREGATRITPDIAIGERLRILPNHACATAAQHAAYHVLDSASGDVVARWPRFSGW